MFGPSSPFFSPNLQPQGPGMGKLPLPKSSGIKGWQGDPGKLPTRAGDTRQRLWILLASQGFLAMGCDMGHFLKTQHPCRGNPQDTWGPECGGLTREPGRGCEAGPGKWGQSGRCVCEGRACSAGAGEACKWPGEPRVCGARCDTQCMEWQGRGRAPGVRCAGLACASAARVCRREGSLEPGGPRRWEGHCVHLREGRVLTPAPRRGRRSSSGSGLGSGSGSGSGSRPASRSAHAPAPSPAVAGGVKPAVSPRARLGGARRGPGARPGRGGSRELRRSPGTLPGARRALPRARPPAPSLK